MSPQVLPASEIKLEPVPDVAPTTVGEYNTAAWAMVENMVAIGANPCQLPRALEPINRLIAPNVEDWEEYVGAHVEDWLPGEIGEAFMAVRTSIYDPVMKQFQAVRASQPAAEAISPED